MTVLLIGTMKEFVDGAPLNGTHAEPGQDEFKTMFVAIRYGNGNVGKYQGVADQLLVNNMVILSRATICTGFGYELLYEFQHSMPIELLMLKTYN